VDVEPLAREELEGLRRGLRCSRRELVKTAPQEAWGGHRGDIERLTSAFDLGLLASGGRLRRSRRMVGLTWVIWERMTLCRPRWRGSEAVRISWGREVLMAVRGCRNGDERSRRISGALEKVLVHIPEEVLETWR
jgi:hypothetical protein